MNADVQQSLVIGVGGHVERNTIEISQGNFHGIAVLTVKANIKSQFRKERLNRTVQHQFAVE